MTSYQVAARGGTLDFRLLVALFLLQRVGRLLNGLDLPYGVGHGTRRSLLHNDAPSKFRVQGVEVTPYAFLDLIFYLLGKRGVGMDELGGGKGLSVLGRRGDALILRRESILGRPVPDLAGSTLGGLCGGFFVALCLVGNGGR